MLKRKKVVFLQAQKQRDVVQLVACLLWEQEVVSSSLAIPTKGSVAQWIEQLPSKQ